MLQVGSIKSERMRSRKKKKKKTKERNEARLNEGRNPRQETEKKQTFIIYTHILINI